MDWTSSGPGYFCLLLFELIPVYIPTLLLHNVEQVTPTH